MGILLDMDEPDMKAARKFLRFDWLRSSLPDAEHDSQQGCGLQSQSARTGRQVETV